MIWQSVCLSASLRPQLSIDAVPRDASHTLRLLRYHTGEISFTLSHTFTMAPTAFDALMYVATFA